LLFDVGHQCYTHKLLTGRQEGFKNLRGLGGISGFPKPDESAHDAFATGHASTSISAALGIARGRNITGNNYHVIAVLGDGAMTGGMVYEALNDAGQSHEKIIVILNDNGMSIHKNVGGVDKQLARLRIKPGYIRIKDSFRRFTTNIPCGRFIYRIVHNTKLFLKRLMVHGSMFEDMGFAYLGPIDGHDVKSICNILEIAQGHNAPVLLHLRTIKGKGYIPAEDNPVKYHGVNGFHINTGQAVNESNRIFSDVFGSKLESLAKKDERITAITAAMQSGTGLDNFAREYPNRFFDVGIAEEHAATMSAGMAIAGLIPVFAVYSTFLQRCYDMLIHDIALQKLHVVLAVDRAGLVGEDGETHQGIYDIGFLRQVPGITVFCPSSYTELEQMLEQAIFNFNTPVAIRYPRGNEGQQYKGLSDGVCEIIRMGSDITLCSYGIMINEVLVAASKLELDGISCEVVKLNILSGDLTEIHNILISSTQKTGRFVMVEDCFYKCSVGREVVAELMLSGLAIPTHLLNIKQDFISHGSMDELKEICGIDSNAIYSAVLEIVSNKFAK
jgi:1-deoxy-D-xylulose-5-phosphate synthase